MRVCFLDHNGKARYLAEQLFSLDGFEPAQSPFETDVLLADTDHPDAPPAPQKIMVIREAIKRGVQVGLYPHGGLPVLDYDGWRTPLDLAFELVHGEGNRLIYERIGLRRRVEPVGWSYSDVAARKPAQINHVVFAPIHPWTTDGRTILDHHQALNEVAYQCFLDFECERKTVRLFGEDIPNGIRERVDGVDYQQSDLSLGIDLIDTADAVISYGTFQCVALARGKPVASIYPYPAHTDDFGRQHARTFSEYADLCRYPAQIGDAPLEELFRRDTSEWERLFVGGPLNTERLAEVLLSYRPNRAQRRKRARV